NKRFLCAWWSRYFS
ncbi:tRNA synthetase class II core domain family protein, partial [Chlamydia psittaci 06-1683]